MEVDSNVQEAELEECADLWYMDGTVILQAENTLFRVYAGVLSHYSPIFRTLFQVPQPAEQERYLGCPLVRLSHDTVHDVRCFLKAVHDVEYSDALFFCPDVAVVAGILRIATKYEVRPIRNKAIKILQKAYPTTLKEYLTRSSHFDPAICPARRIYVVNLLRETNVQVLLPAALLFCCFNSVEEILDGVMFNGKHIELSAADKTVVFRGRQRLTHWARTRAYNVVFQGHAILNSLCSDDKKCAGAWGAFMSKITVDGWMNPFETPDWYFPSNSLSQPLCLDCRKIVTDHYRTRIHALWLSLPNAFGLGCWDSVHRSTFRDNSDED